MSLFDTNSHVHCYLVTFLHTVMEGFDVDVVVIGAGKPSCSLQGQARAANVRSPGLSGIAFARFYLDTHPKSRLTILEKDAWIGGVWGSGKEP